ncbi:MAG: hypothetical protein ACJ72H_11775 [Candidatus Sulfotelmatobacter sp.]
MGSLYNGSTIVKPLSTQGLKMKPLELLLLEVKNKGWRDLKSEPRKGYFNDVYRNVAPKVRGLIEEMANTHSLDGVRHCQKDLPKQTELSELSDRELLKMCDQIRVLWQDLSGNAGKNYQPPKHRILDEWWSHYPLSDAKRWTISYPTRTFFPLATNFRALIATVIFENRTHMRTCSNCLRYFFGPRHDSKYCMRKECQRAYNNERQGKHNKRKAKAVN